MNLTFHEHDKGCADCMNGQTEYSPEPTVYINEICPTCGPTATLRVTSEQELRDDLPLLVGENRYGYHNTRTGSWMSDGEPDYPPEPPLYRITTRVLIIEPWEGCADRVIYLLIGMAADSLGADRVRSLLASGKSLTEILGIDRIEIDCKAEGCFGGLIHPTPYPVEGEPKPCPRCHELREVVYV